MIGLLQGRAGIAGLAGVLLLCSIASAQQQGQVVAQRNLSYEASREVSVQGKVVRYAENSTTAPFGAHVTVQTGSGALDVHLGDARLLDSNHFTVAAGDEVRVVGENVTFGNGTQFVARIIQKGNQAVASRSTRGLPLRPAAAGKNSAGAL
jgi:hypothetical protein